MLNKQLIHWQIKMQIRTVQDFIWHYVFRIYVVRDNVVKAHVIGDYVVRIYVVRHYVYRVYGIWDYVLRFFVVLDSVAVSPELYVGTHLSGELVETEGEPDRLEVRAITIEEGQRQKRRQRSSLLFGFNSLPLEIFSTRMILKKRMNRIKATRGNGCFEKIDDHPVQTIPTKSFVQHILASKW